MIIDLWAATISPGKETEAIEQWKKMAQMINDILGINSYRVMRPESGLRYKVLLVGEIESHAVREKYLKILNDNEEWQTFYNMTVEKKLTDIVSTEHHFYSIVE